MGSFDSTRSIIPYTQTGAKPALLHLAIDNIPLPGIIYNPPIPPRGILKEKRDTNMSDDPHVAENTDTSCPFCSGKHKERDEKEYKDLMNRLKRIEGQVRGIEGMLEDDAYCTDILIQVSAVTSALNSFNKVLLANHMKTCVAENIREGNDEVIDELVTTMQKLMK